MLKRITNLFDKKNTKLSPSVVDAGLYSLKPNMVSKDARRVVETLQRAGYEAYVVGGSVRDLLLNIIPKDFDVATSAEPSEIKALFRRSRIIGRRFQIVHVQFSRELIEVTTFRSNEESDLGSNDKGSGLRQQSQSGMLTRDNVFGNVSEDASRRDLTVNALYYDPSDNTIHDFTDGLSDIGLQLTMTAPAGTIYYTLDGSDPRDASIASPNISVSAIKYDPNISPVIVSSTLAKARVLSGATWSALNEASFFVDAIPADSTNLVISELNYHPLSDDDAVEFIELMNIGNDAIDLSGVEFIRGVTFNFDQNSTLSIPVLAPGERIVLVGKSADFAIDYPGIPIAGQFVGDLSNTGENITLIAADGSTIQDSRDNDKLPWPTSPDGTGFTLVLVAPDKNPDHQLSTSWRPSTASGGNPTTSDALLFTGEPNVDLDSDGMTALLEYALGTDDFSHNLLNDVYDLIGPQNNLTFVAQRSLSADDAIFILQTSSDLQSWVSADGLFALSKEENLGNGNARFTWSLRPSIEIGTQLFVRLKVELRTSPK